MLKLKYQQHMDDLRNTYINLPWYKWLFFPRGLSKAIVNLPPQASDCDRESAVSVITAYLSSTSPFLRFFHCIFKFGQSSLVQDYNRSRHDLSFLEDDSRMPIPAHSSTPPSSSIPPQSNLTFEVCLTMFGNAIMTGDINTLNKIKNLYPTRLQEMIEDGDYVPFCYVAARGHLAVLNWLKVEAPTYLQPIIEMGNYSVFRIAASNGHLAVLNWLKTEAPARLQAMIEADSYNAFWAAACHGHLAVLNWLKTEAPARLQAMIEVLDYTAFHGAAAGGHLAVLSWLKTEAPSHLQAMIEVGHYAAFRFAAQNGHLDVLNWLLSFPACFTYAEMHEREYSHFTHPFMADKLTALRNRQAAWRSLEPFDITDANEATLCFYMIRNLIRRNDAGVLDDIRFLLEIPVVKALAHQSINGGPVNELVRLAITTGNQAAAQILLSIQAVRELTARDNYYRSEQAGGLDLSALARDRESSMTALSSGEQARLASAIERYQPVMMQAGGEPLFEQLLDTLKSRYAAKPATLTKGNGETIILPVDWDGFTALELSDANHAAALKAYYQHQDHTALRYLSRPNPWIHPEASYVYINEARTERWATFEDYKPLIVMLWLAAQDVTAPATDDHTIESRITQFIAELALIGRAHNWDRSDRTYEYDDLTGDRPSCFSGVKRRLFQAVRGHALLNILTEEGVKQEVRNFVRKQMKETLDALTPEKRDELYSIWEKLIAGDDVNLELLDILNITPEQQTQFLDYMAGKYDVFKRDPAFKNIILTYFPTDSPHATTCDAFVVDLLTKPTVSLATSPHTLFAAGEAPGARAGVGRETGHRM